MVPGRPMVLIPSVVGYQHGEFIDFDIEEALQMQKGINEYQFEVSHLLSI